MFNNVLFFLKSCCLWDNVSKYCEARQTSDDDTTHVHCMLDIKSYKHTTIISNNCWFSTATMFFTNAPPCDVTCTRAVHKETEILLFFLIYCFTYNLIKLISFKALISTLDTPLPTFFFSSSVTRPGTRFAGWREGPVLNFLLSPLPSEIGDLLVRI